MSDYLKFYKIVYWYTRKVYTLSNGELDMILYLYSEKYFTEEYFNSYSKLFGYDMKLRNMVNRGFIMIYAKRYTGRHVYQLTPTATKIVHFIYRTLNGKPISMVSKTMKALGRRDALPSERKYLEKIMKMNEWLLDKKKNPDRYIMPPIE